jgi:predicted MFS family arabinose efflux permease
LAYIPGSTIVSHYFDKWRVLANGIMMCGGGSGNFAMAYIMTVSIEHFGWRGSMFILAGIYLNLCVVGFLIRKPPVPYDQREQKRTKIVQLGMFKNLNYVMMICHAFLLTCGLSIIYVHITAFAEERIGLTKNESYLVISLLGVFNVVGRIAQGVGGQNEKVDILTLYLGCLFLSGVFAATYPTTRSFAGVLGFSSVIGFLIAPYGGLILIVLQQFVGLRLLTAAYGYVMLSSAFGFSLGAPMAGKLNKC